MVKLVGSKHAQSSLTAWRAVGLTVGKRMSTSIERNSCNAALFGTGLVDIPIIKGRISGHMARTKTQGRDHLLVKWMIIGHIVFVEGLSILSQDEIPILGKDGTHN